MEVDVGSPDRRGGGGSVVGGSTRHLEVSGSDTLPGRLVEGHDCRPPSLRPRNDRADPSRGGRTGRRRRKVIGLCRHTHK